MFSQGTLPEASMASARSITNGLVYELRTVSSRRKISWGLTFTLDSGGAGEQVLAGGYVEIRPA